jgi:hypothetical protein
MSEMFIDDLRAKVHRGLEGQAIKGRWCGGRPYGYRLKAITDPSRLDAYGNPAAELAAARSDGNWPAGALDRPRSKSVDPTSVLSPRRFAQQLVTEFVTTMPLEL